ncbi:hypothetical protein TW85_24875 [Marinomonas sp. S3726]|uniref:hypothetical protein n=1 Tax=Marinomonas sp. S3726 TaxID=579484 RepID=UPI0005FA7076|nr:hypothetical protein [Marinomonas sp. S3726]KJZ07226.1 hypothetical protein TW85_24875 [Marinomonas sp. S3726]
MAKSNPKDPIELAVESVLVCPFSIRDYERYLEKLVSRAAIELSGVQGSTKAASFVKGVGCCLELEHGGRA